MPPIKTNNTENTDIFQTILTTLLENKPLSQYSENTLFTFMEYLASHTDFRKISIVDFDKLTSIQSKFSSFYCAENFHLQNNQTTPSYFQFLNFTEALQEKEEFFHPHYTGHQTHLNTDCETILNSDAKTSMNLTQLTAAATHGAFAGSVNAFTAIALESVKNKGYSTTQRRLLKAGSDVFNSFAIASYASMTAYTENLHEPSEVILEKMWQSFAVSLAGSTSLYALINGISYFTKSIENKLAKGILNALPLAGNLALLAKGGNNVIENAAMLGTNIGSACIVSAAIQSGWNFFSKRRNSLKNTDLELESDANSIDNASLIATTSFVIENSNNQSTHHYEVIEDGIENGYLPMKGKPKLDSEGYLLPNPLIPVKGSTTSTSQSVPIDNNGYSHPKPPIPVTKSIAPTSQPVSIDNNGYSHPKPPIPVTKSITHTSQSYENLSFLTSGGLNLSAIKEEDNISQPANLFNRVSYTR